MNTVPPRSTKRSNTLRNVRDAMGSMPSKGGINLYCAVIVKKVDAKTRAKTSLNELLRGD